MSRDLEDMRWQVLLIYGVDVLTVAVFERAAAKTELRAE